MNIMPSTIGERRGNLANRASQIFGIKPVWNAFMTVMNDPDHQTNILIVGDQPPGHTVFPITENFAMNFGP